MVGFFAQQPQAAATRKAAIARAWQSRRRSGKSNGQSPAVEAINVKSTNVKAINVKAHAKELPGLGGIHHAKYATNSPTASERDDSPLAMFRRMDGAAVGSGAGAGAGVALPERDTCSPSLERSQHPLPARAALRASSTTRTVAVVPHLGGGSQVPTGAVVVQDALPVNPNPHLNPPPNPNPNPSASPNINTHPSLD